MHLGYFWPNYQNYIGIVSPLSMRNVSGSFSYKKTLVLRSKTYNSQIIPKYYIGRKEFRQEPSHFRLRCPDPFNFLQLQKYLALICKLCGLYYCNTSCEVFKRRYKIRKIFAKESTYPKAVIELSFGLMASCQKVPKF